MDIDHISASGLKTYEQCPLKFYSIYIKKMPEPPPHPNTLMGSATHAILENTVNALLVDPERKIDPFQFKASACEEFKVEKNLYKTIDELVGNSISWGYLRNIKHTVGCELDCSFKLSNGMEVKGRIDRLDMNGCEADIIDIKTQKNEFTAEELDHNWQAMIYNIGSRRHYPNITGNANVSFWVLRHQVQRIVKTKEDAETDFQKLEAKVQEIKDCNDPQGFPSALCPWCPNVKECRFVGMSKKQLLYRK